MLVVVLAIIALVAGTAIVASLASSNRPTSRAIISNNTIDSTIDINIKTKYLFGLGLNKLVVGWGRHI